MIVIGLTGSIGSGKSEVSKMLGQLGASIIDADRIGHETYLPGSPAWHQLIEVFGQGIVKVSGEIDRKKLGTIVFEDPVALETLNRIMHPIMQQMVKDNIQKYRKTMAKVVVLEAALLIEAGWHTLVDEIWIMSSSKTEILKRLRSSRGMTNNEIRNRMKSQMGSSMKEQYATVIIDNSGTIDELRVQVQGIWSNRINLKG